MTAVHWPSLALTLGLGALGGWLAKIAGLPLPWLLGALLVTASAAILGWKPLGHTLGLPTPVRLFFVPVIGVSIGAAVTPGLGADLARWAPSLAALLLFIPLAHVLSYRIARALGVKDRATALYATMPGGFVEAMTLAEDARADVALVTVMQFLRLILCIVTIPLAFALATGGPVGSATGAVIGGTGHVLTPADWAMLAAAGAAGALGGRAVGLPAGIITGPILVSGLLHLAGWVEGAPPRWLIDLTQLAIGLTLGARFAGRGRELLVTGLRTALATVAATMSLSALFALALAPLAGETWRAAFLAYAPGGLAEMSLVALSLEISVIYVTIHHVARILVSVALARAIGRRMGV